MDLQAIVIMCIVGIIAGFLASFVVGGGTLITYLASGLVGAVVGGFIFRKLGINLNISNELVRDIIVATVGAIIVVILARLIA